MDQLMTLLPMLMQHKQAADAVADSSIWDSLKAGTGQALGLPQPATPATPPIITPQDVNPKTLAMPSMPQIDPALDGAGMDFPENGSDPVGNTPWAALKLGLQDPNVARALLMAGASQLSGDSLSKTAGIGFGTYDTLEARDAGKAKAKRDRKIEEIKLKNDLANDKSTRQKNTAQGTLYEEQAKTEGSVRNKNNAAATKSAADAQLSKAKAKKAGLETEKLTEPDTVLMGSIAEGLGYTPEETEDGKYLQDPDFLRQYNASVTQENAKLYNKFTSDEKTQYIGLLNDEEHPWHKANHSQIMDTLDLEGVYSPKSQKEISQFLANQIKRRDKLRTQKESAAQRKPRVKTPPVNDLDIGGA